MRTLAALLFLCLGVSAAETLPLDQWRACPVSEADFRRLTLPPKPEWFFVGHPLKSFQQEKLFSHPGPIAYYTHFHLDAFPDDACPLLLLNGLPEGSAVLFRGKPLEQVKAKNQGAAPFAVERWYRLTPGAVGPGKADNARLELWTPTIRKGNDAKLAPLSKLCYTDPDVLEAREKQKRLRSPYLHEETEDPYVARHW